MTLRDRQIGDVTILDLGGRMTIEDGADIFRAVIRQLLALSRTRLILNLHDVPYIDSTGLAEIVRVHTSVSRRGGSLRLLHVTPHVKELLVVTKLLPAFDLREDEAEAVRSFA